MKRLVTICAIFFIVSCSANSAMAILMEVWWESGDAGELLSTAQVVLGSGRLDAITGAYDDWDADMYQIYISDVARFSARASTSADPQLFLFDASGIGVYANDDDVGFVASSAFLPSGHANSPTSAGLYYLAISGYDLDPYSEGGLMFPSTPRDEVHGPTAAGFSPITHWSSGSGLPNSDSYDILLRGAQYVPAPGAVMLGILGLSVAGLKLRKFT